MKERPILFSAPMVRAILAGKKTQTRRIVKPQPEITRDMFPTSAATMRADGSSTNFVFKITERPGIYRCLGSKNFAAEFCPYGQPGDRLWVRETCHAEEKPSGLDGVRYLADNHFQPIENSPGAAFKWMHLNAYRAEAGARVPSIHMPRWASRITLEVVGVRVERLNDCSEEDARAEGVKTDGVIVLDMPSRPATAVECYETLWEQINGDGSWAANPWVWVVEFKVIEGGSKA